RSGQKVATFRPEGRKINLDSPDRKSNPDLLVTHQELFHISYLRHRPTSIDIVILINFNSESRKNNSDHPDRESNSDLLVTH
ncbi:Protein of unknown function, partial [Cotesia congregata]